MAPEGFPGEVWRREENTSPEVRSLVYLLYLRTQLVFQVAALLDIEADVHGNHFAIEALSGTVRGSLEDVLGKVNEDLEEDLQYLLRRLSQYPDAYQKLTESVVFREYAEGRAG